MKKVLIIGHFWPYRTGGGFRTVGLAKYLNNFGWEPVIITGALRQKPEIPARYIEVEYGNFLGNWVKIFGFNPKNDIGDQLKGSVKRASFGVKSFLKLFYNAAREIFAWPDEDKYFIKPALKEARKILSVEKIDAIISEHPVSSHIVASKLKEEFKIPWIADFVDLWSQNHNYPYSRIRKSIETKFEKKTIRDSDALVTVTDFLADNLKKLYKDKKIFSITNGFDPEKANIPPANLSKKFTIIYTGQIFVGKRDPEKFLKAVSELISEKKIDPNDINIEFYCSENTWLAEKITDLGLSAVAKQCGVKERKIAIQKQRESQILLLLNWRTTHGEGVYTGKIFEYFAAMRPILVTEGIKKNNFIKELIERTHAGASGGNVEEIKKILSEFYSQYKKDGSVKYSGNWEEIKKYSYYEMVGKFANILNEIS